MNVAIITVYGFIAQDNLERKPALLVSVISARSLGDYQTAIEVFLVCKSCHYGRVIRGRSSAVDGCRFKYFALAVFYDITIFPCFSNLIFRVFRQSLYFCLVTVGKFDLTFSVNKFKVSENFRQVLIDPKQFNREFKLLSFIPRVTCYALGDNQVISGMRRVCNLNPVFISNAIFRDVLNGSYNTFDAGSCTAAESCRVAVIGIRFLRHLIFQAVRKSQSSLGFLRFQGELRKAILEIHIAIFAVYGIIHQLYGKLKLIDRTDARYMLCNHQSAIGIPFIRKAYRLVGALCISITAVDIKLSGQLRVLSDIPFLLFIADLTRNGVSISVHFPNCVRSTIRYAGNRYRSIGVYGNLRNALLIKCISTEGPAYRLVIGIFQYYRKPECGFVNCVSFSNFGNRQGAKRIAGICDFGIRSTASRDTAGNIFVGWRVIAVCCLCYSIFGTCRESRDLNILTALQINLGLSVLKAHAIDNAFCRISTCNALHAYSKFKALVRVSSVTV